MAEINGLNNTCGGPHCNDLTYADGTVREDYCTIFAICEDGVARTTGFSW